MFEEFFKKFTFLLNQRGYDMQASQANCRILQKVVGPSIYLTLVIDSDNFEGENLMSTIISYGEEIKANFENLGIKSLFVVYILVSETKKPVIDEILAMAEPFSEQAVYEIFWGLTLSDYKLINNPVQPDEVGGLRAAIEQTKDSKKSLKPMYTQSIEHRVILTPILIALNCIVFILLTAAEKAAGDYVYIAAGALVPDYVIYGHEYNRMVNSMFIHFGMAHLASNCLNLYIFGQLTEKYYSKIEWLIIYFLSGLTGNLLSLFTVSGISAGASGAICGLMGAALVTSIVAPRSAKILNTYYLVLIAIMCIGIGFVVTNINNTAHIGGMVSGALIAYLLHISNLRKSQGDLLFEHD